MRSGCTTLTRLRTFIPNTSTHPLEWHFKGQRGSGLNRLRTSVGRFNFRLRTVNGVWPPLRPVSVAQKNEPSTMLSSNVQSIAIPRDCTTWRLWTMRNSNGCSTSAPRSSGALPWTTTRSKDEEHASDVYQHSYNRSRVETLLKGRTSLKNFNRVDKTGAELLWPSSKLL